MKRKPNSMVLLKGSSSETTLAAEGILTIQDSARLRDLMLEAYAGGGDLHIDLGEIESIDLACLQVVCSVNMTYQKTGRNIGISRSSRGVTESLRHIGIEPERCSLRSEHRCIWAKGTGDEQDDLECR